MRRLIETTAAAALAGALLVAVMPASVLHAAGAVLQAAQSEPGAVIVRIDGMRADAGRIRIGVYASKDAWDSGQAAATGWAEAAASPVQVVFEDLAPGEYGLQVFHDENGNQALDTNFMGVPQERYGFSNNPRPRFRGARWEEAVFTLSPSETLEMTIALQGAAE